MLRKLIDSSIAKNYGWKSKISLKEGLNLVLSDLRRKNIIC